MRSRIFVLAVLCLACSNLSFASSFCSEAPSGARAVFSKIFNRGAGGKSPQESGGGTAAFQAGGGGGGGGGSGVSGSGAGGGLLGLSFVENGLYGKVFQDQNKDGWPNQGEKGLADVKVVSDTHKETKTDQDGNFKFSSLEEGTRVIRVDETTVPKNSAFTTPHEKQVIVADGLSSRVLFGLSQENEE